MKIAIFGATGALGGECLRQSLSAGHDIVVLARNPTKLPDDIRNQIRVVQGNGLDPNVVSETLSHNNVEAVLFAIGVDGNSPEDLCTDCTRNILSVMRKKGSTVRRLVWCGGGSTLVEDDVGGYGPWFVRFFARTFLGLRHRDKDHQYELLQDSTDVEWVGLRPLQMHGGPRRETYRVGFDYFSGLSKITFADCAHAMIAQLTDDRWLHRAPIIQY